MLKTFLNTIDYIASIKKDKAYRKKSKKLTQVFKTLIKTLMLNFLQNRNKIK